MDIDWFTKIFTNTRVSTRLIAILSLFTGIIGACFTVKVLGGVA